VDEDEERPATGASIADPAAVQGDLAVLHRVSQRLSAILPEHGTTCRSRGRPRPPYQQREGIRLVIAKVQISEDGLEISIHRRPTPEEVLEKLRAPGTHSPRRSETSIWLPGVMAQRASLRDQTSLAVGKRRSNRTVYILRNGARAA